MAEVNDRFVEIESRLACLEQLLQSLAMEAVSAKVIKAEPSVGAIRNVAASSNIITARQPTPARKAVEKQKKDSVSVTNILGWTGATALVLAMAYLIRLALDAGWLTPERQLAIAVASGFSLIGAGLWLRASDRVYASLLPAGGLVVLFLSIYGAHLYYHFVGIHMAAGAVIVTCLGALWLGRLFESELYGLFAVVGSYSAPFLLHALASSVTDLVIYYSAWSVLFCIYSIWIGNRRAYLLAAYMALLGFNFLWKQMAPAEWGAALLFQAIQFVIFLVGAAGFSIHHERPMEKEESLVHLPLLLIFYALQYSLLQVHLPMTAPWIALGSAAALLLVYLVARKSMDKPLESGTLLVGAYTSLVLFHAGYMELIPQEFAPWVGLILLPVVAAYFLARGKGASVTWPVLVLIGIVFTINYLRVMSNTNIKLVPGHEALALLYAVELYLAYYLSSRMHNLTGLITPALYAGHVAIMGAAVQIFDGRLVISLFWGAIGLASLILGFMYKDKVLGKSSLLIFAISTAKVMLFDLSSATPLVRISSLVILGVTLYAGGWMYKKVDLMDTQNPQASTV